MKVTNFRQVFTNTVYVWITSFSFGPLKVIALLKTIWIMAITNFFEDGSLIQLETFLTVMIIFQLYTYNPSFSDYLELQWH